eukprot:363490-Chlamydomonas_euryale.AAC.3
MMLRPSAAAASLTGCRAGTLAAANGGCGAAAAAAPARPCTSAHPRLQPTQHHQQVRQISARAAMGAASAAAPRSPGTGQATAKRGAVAATTSSPAPSGAAPSDVPDVRELAKMAQIGLTDQEVGSQGGGYGPGGRVAWRTRRLSTGRSRVGHRMHTSHAAIPRHLCCLGTDAEVAPPLPHARCLGTDAGAPPHARSLGADADVPPFIGCLGA